MNFSMSFDSSGLDQTGQKQCAAWQFGDDDVLVNGVSTVADSAHAVERGDADAGGEVAVRAAADRGFVQLPVDLSRRWPAPFYKEQRRRRCAPWAGG